MARAARVDRPENGTVLDRHLVTRSFNNVGTAARLGLLGPEYTPWNGNGRPLHVPPIRPARLERARPDTSSGRRRTCLRRQMDL